MVMGMGMRWEWSVAFGVRVQKDRKDLQSADAVDDRGLRLMGYDYVL